MKEEKIYGFSINDKSGASLYIGAITDKLAGFMFDGSPEDPTPEIKRRLIFLAFLSITGSLTLLFFGILSIYQNNLIVGVFDITMAAFLSANLIYARKRRNFYFNICLALSVFSFYYIYLYISGGFNQTGFVWYYTYPLGACFLLGSKRGALASGLLILPVILLLILNPSHPFFTSYNQDFEIRFVFSYALVALFSFFFENGSENSIKEIYTINAKLEDLVAERTKELSSEIELHKKAKNQLRQSEHHYKTMFEKSVNALFLFDKNSGKYLDANPAAEKLTGRSREQLVSLTAAEITPDFSGIHAQLSTASDSSSKMNTIRFIQPDGKERQAFFNATPLTDHILMGVAQDVTDLQKTEKERQKLEARLNQAQKMEAIGNLAGGIAHDFNNILTSVLGFTELSLNYAKEGSIQQENLQEVRAAGLRAKDLVNQILAFARQSDATVKPLEIGGVVSEVIKLLRASIPTTIEINQSINCNSVTMANETQMHQVIMNLCTNAAQAMQETGGILGIDMQEAMSSEISGSDELGLSRGKYVILQISDTGKGIDPAIINSIFEPYFTTKKVGEGTGMGLAMVKGIVESCGGTITVESTPDTSTVFTIYLPVTTSRLNQSNSNEYQPSQGNERILLVDDEPPIARMASQMLEGLGYSVTSRTSSYEALELFREKANAFDIVITDMTMPQITGADLAAELIKIRPDIPILLCSGYSDQISPDDAKRIGIREFAYKPFTKAELSEKIQMALGKN